MASSIWRKRSDTAPPSIKNLIHVAPGSLIDALVILAIGLSVGLYFGFSNDAREWAIEALGYGWVPVGLLVAVTLVTLRYNRHILFTHWRRWIIATALVAMSVGVLSTIFPSDGALEDVSLAGKWGGYLGGDPEILAAVKKIIRDGIPEDQVDEALFQSYLFTGHSPDPDLIIRTGGEMRISNFLLWQSAYSEYYHTPTLWPDLESDEIERVLEDYSTRQRRFGRVEPED